MKPTAPKGGWRQALEAAAASHRTRPVVAMALLAYLALAPGPALAAIGELPSASEARASAEEQGRLRLESAIELREDLALRADRRFVARLETTPGAGRRTGSLGIALAGAEARALKRRERAVASVESTVTRYVRRPAARAAFAGLFIDQDAGGVVRAGFTRGAERRESELRALSSHPGRVTTFEASHTQRALVRAAREIGRDLPLLRALGVHRVGVDVSSNAVMVAATEPDARVEDELAARYPDAPIEVRATSEARLAANYERFQVPPVVGAIEIFRRRGEGFVFCSAGFVVRPRGTERHSVVTAGHCGERGQTFRHRRIRGGTYRVGAVGRDAFRQGTTADAMLLDRRQADAAPYIHTPGRQPGRSNPKRQLRGVESAERKDEATEGEIVCRSSAGSDFYLGQGVFCGEVRGRSVAALVFPGPVLVRRHVVANVVTCAGDSGGPVYRRHQAKGLASASGDPLPEAPDCGRTLLYSQIGHVEDRLNADVVTQRR